ncbi:MAG: hypothetical protein GY816_10645 [Cytophagales bacterium]|nr:hypothetical protein [Cytophagales bacterium]
MIRELSNYIPFVLIPLIWWGLRRGLIKKNNYGSLKKITLHIGLVAFFLTEMGRSFYRPSIYKNDFFDYYISDTIGNSLGTVTAVFMLLTHSGKGTKQDFKIIGVIVLGLIVYEFMNLASRFDYHDVIATLIFGVISTITYNYLLNKDLQKSDI